MSEQANFYIDNAERLIGKDKANTLKRLLIEQRTSAFFTREDKKHLDALIFELMSK